MGSGHLEHMVVQPMVEESSDIELHLAMQG